ncbi:MAG: ribokinase [Lactobacillaceae bacterium]|jgi:ribokinase|nr:ribokinase [Lactobacillaceae bacterium]
MDKKIVVIGSLNIDIVLNLARLPREGETLSLSGKTINFGGKGANQAVAAKRQGSHVDFIGAVGKDSDGDSFINLFDKEGIGFNSIERKVDVSTGNAYIMLEDDSHNTIMVLGGANMALTVEDVEKHKALIESADVVVAQLEVPQAAIDYGFKIAHENGALTILNPAPVTNKVLPSILKNTDLLVPNETEAAALLNLEPTTEIDKLVERIPLFERLLGVKNFVVTLGDQGAFYNVNGDWNLVKALKVDAIDTTAAGDTFIGTMAAHIQKDLSNIVDVLKMATAASSIVVTRDGAIPAIPRKEEVIAEYEKM